MRYVLAMLLALCGFGCDKTIHECRAPAAPGAPVAHLAGLAG